MKVVVILPNREEFLAYEILKSLLRYGAEVYCAPLEIIKFMLVSANKDLEIGIDCLKKCKICNDFEIIEHAKDADYIFALGSRYHSPNYTNCGYKFFLLDEIGMPEKTIFIDGSEWTASGWKNSFQIECLKNKEKKNFYRGEPWIDKFMRERSRWYFKRETYLEDYQNQGIIPLPYPHRVEDKQIKGLNDDREIDLFVSFGQVNTGLRSDVIEIIKTDFKEFRVLNSFTDNKNFFSNLLNSYLAVDAWGAGNCNVRSQMIQINSVALICQKWEILTPYPFKDGENIIEYSTVQEFIEKCQYYLENKEILIKIGKKGYEHSIKFHTSEKRLEYILNIINGKLDLTKKFGNSNFYF